MIKNLIGQVDRKIFFFASLSYLLLFLYIILLPNSASTVVTRTLNFILNNLGWVYMLSFTGIIFFLVWLAFGKYGKLKLGNDADQPEYSFASWIGMLFGAGLGVGLVFFGVNEPISHFVTAPFSQSGTAQAASDSMRQTFFHWGIHPWAMYSLAGLCLAYFHFRKGYPLLFSSTLIPMLGRERAKGLVGKLVDAFAVIAIVAGVSTSMGVSATQITAALKNQFGVSSGFTVVLAVLSIIAILSIASALRGIAKGIKIISDVNMLLVYFLIAFVFLAGPTKYLFYTFFETLGVYIRDFPWLTFFLDTNSQVEKHVGYNWVGSWTVMYWAWWVAFAPFVGAFLAQISKGRTIKEFVLATSVVPSILCFVWFAGYGGTAIHFDLFQGMKLSNTLVNDAPSSLFIFLQQLPLSGITILLALFLCITLIVTSVNSATYVMGTLTTKGDYIPSMGLRTIWGMFIFGNAALFLYLGGIKTLQNSSMIFALPFMIIIVLMVFNLTKELASEPINKTNPHI